MLVFVCDFCKNDYPVRLSINGYKYSSKDGVTVRDEELPKNPDAPCVICESKGEKMKKKVLYKIKKGEEIVIDED